MIDILKVWWNLKNVKKIQVTKLCEELEELKTHHKSSIEKLQLNELNIFRDGFIEGLMLCTPIGKSICLILTH